jgi:hypothetical protein
MTYEQAKHENDKHSFIIEVNKEVYHLGKGELTPLLWRLIEAHEDKLNIKDAKG